MEFLQNIFGNGTDLAAVASGAGLFGGGVSTLAALMISGTIQRFILRTLLTAVLTGVGFLFLLDYLGFEIVPPEDLKQSMPFGQSYDNQSMLMERSAPAGEDKPEQQAQNDEDRNKSGAPIRYVVKSPFS